MLAIIGGSGLTRLSTLAVAHREVVRTPYGEPSSALLFGQIAGRDVVFLARHGHGHTIPPHRVNYRANLWALKERGATAILAVASVGGIRGAAPGDLVLPHQLIDYTHDRESTFFDGGDQHVVHVDFTASLHAGAARAVPRRGARRGHRARRRRRLRRGVGSAARNRRRDRPDGARRRDAGRDDRDAGSGARARARAAVRGDRGRRQPCGRPRRSRTRCRWKASPRCWRRRWTRSARCSTTSRR